MSKSAQQARLEHTAKCWGATVEDCSNGTDVKWQVTAPAGRKWVSTDSPHLMVSCGGPVETWMQLTVNRGVREMATGHVEMTETEKQEDW